MRDGAELFTSIYFQKITKISDYNAKNCIIWSLWRRSAPRSIPPSETMMKEGYIV
jgi:hypothetical protein